MQFFKALRLRRNMNKNEDQTKGRSVPLGFKQHQMGKGEIQLLSLTYNHLYPRTHAWDLTPSKISLFSLLRNEIHNEYFSYHNKNIYYSRSKNSTQDFLSISHKKRLPFPNVWGMCQ